MPNIPKERETSPNEKNKDKYKRFKIPYTKEQILKIFKRYDKNGDGQLSKAELKEAFAELGAICPGLRAWDGRRHADDDGDGFISIDKELDKLGDYTVGVGYIVN
ncbi:hypothetical protein D8674_039785 [Pyrus ussuriensis x Pyrus communis]|uniref:EF-hand domain-containing protein n=1 Tax=Pyrus ussuriensis x Pyrus communis TaxID=2448454 RepID=A0A5N5FCF5_9ROSA|nr:hypothetical protein D8674_039785 [Pyrus ussuriensis x Pyrus communis]